ncbi:hypothetical protein CHCC14820_1794 [Bacillus paralicheniformis]|nr:hypothetical protein CHCC14820_1794 [Bacillus paralicheniformis]
MAKMIGPEKKTSCLNTFPYVKSVFIVYSFSSAVLIAM